MAREKKVVDASVILKWFLDESDSLQARQLLAHHTKGELSLVVPDFAFLEVLNVLRYKSSDEASIHSVHTTLWNHQLHVEKLNHFLLERAASVALAYNITVYDALYVALAHILGVPLITADKALRDIPNVVLLL